MTLKDLESQLLALTYAEKERVIQLLTHSLTIDSPAERACRERSAVAKPVQIGAGEARIGDPQIAIWELVNAKELGCSDADLVQIYPQLTALDLVTAWEYAEANAAEISRTLQELEE
jgi:uncharacterized protein (DUF433 family)